jgi:hypothetical protein
MSETTEPDKAPASIPAVKIVPDVPVIFADGVISQSWGPGISKFYLGRFDGDPEAKKEAISVPVVQMVMPAEGFVQMVAFFEHRLKAMIEKGIVSQDSIDSARAYWLAEKQ